jgi:Flp pilus assembly protein CpaB
VDILSALSDPDTHEMMARTIVENIQIRAVGQRITPGGAEPSKPEDPQAGFRSVTLLVTPKEAESIHVAGTAGRPWLVLRGTGDDHIENTPGVGMVDLRTNNADHGMGARKTNEFAMQHTDKFPATQPIARTRTITFIKGGKIETITVDEASAPPIFQGTLTNTDTGPAASTTKAPADAAPTADTASEQAPAIPDVSTSDQSE